MAKYKFKEDFIQNYRVYDSKIGTSSSVDQSITFKKGDIVDGRFEAKHTVSGWEGVPMNFEDRVLIENPMGGKGLFDGNGAPSMFAIPTDKLELLTDESSASTQNTGLDLQTFLQKHKNHLLIAGLLVIGYFAYKKFNK
jgi:hypothetical protein